LKNPVDHSGKKFGRLTAVSIAGKSDRAILWLCKCDCGKDHITRSAQLVRGSVKSCGCLKKELLSIKKKTHGLSSTRTFNIWANIRQRCENPNNMAFRYYGSRGISVCDAWQTLEGFIADMGECPGDQMTIERVDVNGNYEKNNCVWASMMDQARNKRRTIRVPLNGRLVCLTEYCDVTGKNYAMMRSRIKEYGWSIDRAVETP